MEITIADGSKQRLSPLHCLSFHTHSHNRRIPEGGEELDGIGLDRIG